MIIRITLNKGIDTDLVTDVLYREAIRIGLTTLYEQKKLETATVALKPVKSKPKHW